MDNLERKTADFLSVFYETKKARLRQGPNVTRFPHLITGEGSTLVLTLEWERPYTDVETRGATSALEACRSDVLNEEAVPRSDFRSVQKQAFYDLQVVRGFYQKERLRVTEKLEPNTRYVFSR